MNGDSKGELSMKDLEVKGGVVVAVVAGGLMIALPLVLSLFIRDSFAASLTHDDIQALSAFLLYAVILGAATTLVVFLYGSHRKGTRPRLLLGMASGALIVVYSFVVLVLSGLTSVLWSIGLQLDTAFVALLIAYASAIIMFSVGGEYVASGKGPQGLASSTPTEPGGGR